MGASEGWDPLSSVCSAVLPREGITGALPRLFSLPNHGQTVPVSSQGGTGGSIGLGKVLCPAVLPLSSGR